jgi:hypothetical protein
MDLDELVAKINQAIMIHDKANDYTDLLLLARKIIASYDPQEYIADKEEMKAKVNKSIEEIYR